MHRKREHNGSYVTLPYVNLYLHFLETAKKIKKLTRQKNLSLLFFKKLFRKVILPFDFFDVYARISVFCAKTIAFWRNVYYNMIHV
jgi:hypothetical protein